MATEWASFFARVVEDFQAQPLWVQIWMGLLLVGSVVAVVMMILYGIWKVRNEW